MEISTFNNEEFGEIRTIQENGEVCFAALILQRRSDTLTRVTLFQGTARVS